MKKIRIAFIKFGGLSAGGTEKFLQTVAAHLPPESFDVTYFYTDSAPYVGSDYRHAGTDPHRLAYMTAHGVRLVKIGVEAKDVTARTHDWVGTNFWDVFHEEDFDLVQSGRSGQPEFPFCRLRKVPIIDSLHLVGGVDNQKNIARVMHITEWSARKWAAMGGDARRVRLVSHPMDMGSYVDRRYRDTLGLGHKFLFGLHQRDDNHIFSSIPLQAFARMAGPENHFLLLGGGSRYRDQARSLGLTNISFLPHSADRDDILSFLSCLNVYAHGRKDGELNSTALAEALYFGLPIVSHYSEFNNGHVECIGPAGIVARTVSEYAEALVRLQKDREIYADFSARAKVQYQNHYELGRQMERIIAIYQDTVQNPFPYPIRRALLDFRQRIFPYRFLWKIRARIDRWSQR